jgi:outer membrane protein assembly factor BamB
MRRRPPGSAASGDNAIQLTWSDALGATEYRIYRSTTSGSGYTQVATVTAPTTAYLDTGLQGGVTYYYAVTTYDGSLACESAFSSEASAKPTGPCDLAPTFSGISSATSSGDCAIDLSWSAATAICDGPVDYSVYRSATSGFTPSLGLGGTSYTDGSGLSSGTTYYYIVRATDQSNGQEDTNTVEQGSGPTGANADGTWSTGAEVGDPAMYTNGSWSISSALENSGTYSYYSGYSDNLCAYLRTPQLTLTAGQASTLAYWTAWDIENRFDGGVVEISTNGGSTWSTLTPTPGYPGSFQNSGDACGYPKNRPAYTGTGNLTFASYSVDLSAYDGEDVMIRWNFSTDGSVTYEGWYVDDITVTHVQVSGPCESTPSDVAYLTARSTSGQVKLEWLNPSDAFGPTRICRDDATYPNDPEACTTVVANKAGSTSEYDTYTDTTVDDGTKYYYTAFVNNGSGVFSGGVNAWAYPFDTSGKVKWSYSSAASSLAPTGVRPGAIGVGGTWAVSNDRLLHGMNPTAAGGDWPRTPPYSWVPMAMNGPAQARPPVVPTTAVPGASEVIFLGSEDGHAYAANARTGETLWQSSKLGNILFASPSGMFTDFGGSWDLLFIGSRDATADNVMYALDPADEGNIEHEFDNGGGASGIGIISSGATVDYANNRIYFASRGRAGGSQDTLWCLNVDETGFSKRWSVPLGDIDGAPVLFQGRLYVGTNTGTVSAVNPDTGVSYWTHAASGDGAVKGFVTPQAVPTFPRRLYFSTTTKLWSINDLGGTATSGWSVTTVPGPSIPLASHGEAVLFVGSSDGRLYQLNATTGAVQTSVMLGDGTATIGGPTFDVTNDMTYVGSESGAVYGVELPLQ